LKRLKTRDSLCFQKSQVCLWVTAHDFGVNLFAVGELDLDLVRIIDHVVIGENVTVRTDHEARSHPLLLRAAMRVFIRERAKEIAKRVSRGMWESETRVLHRLHHLDVDHTRPNFFCEVTEVRRNHGNVRVLCYRRRGSVVVFDRGRYPVTDSHQCARHDEGEQCFLDALLRFHVLGLLYEWFSHEWLSFALQLTP